MTNLKDLVHELHQMIVKGHTLQAIERFYAKDVIVQENRESPRLGRALNLQHERDNLARVRDAKAELRAVAIDEENEVVMAEWTILFTNRKDETCRLDEVSVQRWRAGRVQHERFYYKGLEKVVS